MTSQLANLVVFKHLQNKENLNSYFNCHYITIAFQITLI